MRLTIVLTLIIICSGLFFNSCHKDENKSIDFRDKYLGKYQVELSIRCYGPCFTCSSLRDTVIVVDYGLTDSTLSVLGREVSLDSAGYYSAYHYGLRLWNDSISSMFMNGGLGCGQYEVYTGYRISDHP